MKKVRAIFVSDVHLGLKKSKVKELLKLFDSYEADSYYFVGDIIDFWKLQSSVYWSKQNNELIRKVMKLAKSKSVTYILGNHDEILKDFAGNDFGGIKLELKAEHIAKDGKRVLVIHGDQFDKIILHQRWLAVLGSWMYDVLLELNEINNWIRRTLKLRPWSLSMYLKHKAKQATGLMQNFKVACSEYATLHFYDAVITGHIHKPEIDGAYMNCGDWIENCTAIIEDKTGHFEIVRISCHDKS